MKLRYTLIQMYQMIYILGYLELCSVFVNTKFCTF